MRGHHVLVTVWVLLSLATSANARPGESLVVDGNLLKVGGKRWIARGSNVYVQEEGWKEAVDGLWRNREAM